MLKVPAPKLTERLTRLLSDVKDLENALKGLKREKLQLMLSRVAPTALPNGREIVAASLPLAAEDLRPAAEEISKAHPQAIVVLGCNSDGRAHLLIKLPSALVKDGLQAGALLKEALPLIDGQGGGRAESAQGSGKRADNLEAAIALVVATSGR